MAVFIIASVGSSYNLIGNDKCEGVCECAFPCMVYNEFVGNEPLKMSGARCKHHFREDNFSEIRFVLGECNE